MSVDPAAALAAVRAVTPAEPAPGRSGSTRPDDPVRTDSGPWPAGAIDGLSTAVALVDAVSWRAVHENTRFREWFPASTGAGTLGERVPGLDLERATRRLQSGRPFRLEVALKDGTRPADLRLELRHDEDTVFIIAEAHDITPQKQAEYMLDSYSRLVERQTRELEKEKERAEKLLLNVMPRRVYEELKDFGTTSPQTFDTASVLLLDFAGFTEMPIANDPTALIAELNDVFTSFDQIVDHFHCERIKTIGDAYMAVAGVPEPDNEHAVHLARAALRMRRFLQRRNAASPVQWRPRIGIGSGPVIGSIVGIRKYVYDIFGPAVNIAARMEAQCEPMQILVSAPTWQLIRDDFVLHSLGTFDLRGFGRQEIFLLDDEVRSRRS